MSCICAFIMDALNSVFRFFERSKRRVTGRVMALASQAPVMDRELGAQRDRQIRLHSVHTDIQLDLPPSIPLPDGEEIPYGSSHLLHIRDPDQEREIYQECIRAPPNRTIFDGEAGPPPYRCQSAGMLASSASASSVVYIEPPSPTDVQQSFVRSHSMSSRYAQLPSTPTHTPTGAHAPPSVIIHSSNPHRKAVTAHHAQSVLSRSSDYVTARATPVAVHVGEHHPQQHKTLSSPPPSSFSPPPSLTSPSSTTSAKSTTVTYTYTPAPNS